MIEIERSDLKRSLSSADLVIVGAGLFGATVAEHVARLDKKKVVILERRDHIAGNVFSFDDPATGIHIHKYGPHIFHTSNRAVENYVRRFARFNDYQHRVFSKSGESLYSLPINLHTLSQFFGKHLSPVEAASMLPKPQSGKRFSNFEEAAIANLGEDLYQAFFKGYTSKQWQEDPRNLPASVFGRLPIRFDLNARYFGDAFEGVPVDGYTNMVAKMLVAPEISVLLGVDFFDLQHLVPKGVPVLYTGPIDEYFGYRYGKLKWRTLDFTWEHHKVPSFQGAAQVNYADVNVPWTRIVEYRYFAPGVGKPDVTVTSKEFSRAADRPGDEPFYPVRTSQDVDSFSRYREAARTEKNVKFGGRLGNYAYLDMDMTISSAMSMYARDYSGKI